MKPARPIFRSLLLPAAGLALLTVVAAACARAPQTVWLQGVSMGTTYSIKVVDPPEGETEETLAALVQAELDRIDSLMSTYRDDSELSRLNRAPADQWVDLSPETLAVIQEAIRIHGRSEGALDVTVGPLVNLWHFGPLDPTSQQVPTDEQIERAAESVGIELLEIRDDPPAVRKRKSEVYVDLSAIAQGYGVDRLAELLAGRGIERYMVEFSGEVRAAGRNERGAVWRIGIETPDSATFQKAERVVELNNRSLATSGDYRNFFEAEGKRFSHIIDPRTRRPVEHAGISVSVVADRCTEADGWATALTVLGPEHGRDLAERQGLAVLYIVKNGDAFQTVTTSHWDRLFKPQ